LHLGCGDDRLPGFVNIDCRYTPAVDLVMDLNVPAVPPGRVEAAYSNAFLEHLYRPSRVGHLRAVCRGLVPTSGFACYIGLPYFPNVARFYLERRPGTSQEVFDLFEVYRYTHGDPERVPTWWLAQLHKSLFDGPELAGLLVAAGFRAHALFTYAFPADRTPLPVTVGFYATRAPRPADALRAECREFLYQFPDKVSLDTLEFIPGGEP
jgi:hypothetical protein